MLTSFPSFSSPTLAVTNTYKKPSSSVIRWTGRRTKLQKYSCCKMLGRRICQLLCLSSVLSSRVAATNDISANDSSYDVTAKPYLKGWDPSPCYFEEIDRGEELMWLKCENITSAGQLADIFQKLREPFYLYQLILENLQFKSLPAGVFGRATFYHIFLNKTDIETIDPAAFQGIEDSVNVLSFYDTKIKRFDFMAHMKRLRYVYLHSINFEQLDNRSFANISPKKNITFNFINNTINTIGRYAFANYSGRIYMEGNTVPLTRIGDYAFYTNCKNGWLNIFFNNVKIFDTTLSPKTFVGSRITEIRFRNTSLSTLQQEVFFPLVQNIRDCKRPIITITGNPVKCDQSIKWIVANDTLKKMFNFECENGKKLAQLTKEDLTV